MSTEESRSGQRAEGNFVRAIDSWGLLDENSLAS